MILATMTSLRDYYHSLVNGKYFMFLFQTDAPVKSLLELAAIQKSKLQSFREKLSEALAFELSQLQRNRAEFSHRDTSPIRKRGLENRRPMHETSIQILETATNTLCNTSADAKLHEMEKIIDEFVQTVTEQAETFAQAVKTLRLASMMKQVDVAHGVLKEVSQLSDRMQGSWKVIEGMTVGVVHSLSTLKPAIAA